MRTVASSVVIAMCVATVVIDLNPRLDGDLVCCSVIDLVLMLTVGGLRLKNFLSELL